MEDILLTLRLKLPRPHDLLTHEAFHTLLLYQQRKDKTHDKVLCYIYSHNIIIYVGASLFISFQDSI